jgi:hypothetical protein
VGRVNSVKRFLPNFVMMVKPIHNMLKQDQYFSWTKDVEIDFMGIKEEINSTPISAKPDFDKDFIIYTNSTEKENFAIM